MKTTSMINWDEFVKSANETTKKCSRASLKHFLKICGVATPSFFFAFISFFRKAPTYKKAFFEVRALIESAPQTAKRAYNALVCTLFSGKIAALLKVEEKQEVVLTRAQIQEQECIRQEKKQKQEQELKIQAEKRAEEKRQQERQELIEKESVKLKNASLALIEELYSGPLSMYSDLAKSATSLIDEQMNLSAMSTQEIPRAFQEKLQKIQSVVTLGRERFRKMHEIAEFQKEALLATTRLDNYLDLKQQQHEFQEKIHSFSVAKSVLQNTQSTVVDANINSAYEKMKTMKEESKALFDSIDRQIFALEAGCLSSVRIAKRRLFEIFTCITPFPDIRAVVEKEHLTLLSQVESNVEQFFKGQITRAQFQNKIFSIAYDPDVKQLRLELGFRATRLREIRAECHRLLEKAEKARRFLEIAHLTNIAFYKEITALIKELFSYLDFVENPFDVFQEAILEFEGSNLAFRKLWIRLEELQKKVEMTTRVVPLELQPHFETIRRQFFKTIDNLEEALKTIEGVRPNLVYSLQRELEEATSENFWQLFVEMVSKIEKRYPFLRPFLFFMSIDGTKTRQELILEAKKLNDHIESCKKFAKSVQYIKVFEEEKIDVILEAFERESTIEDGD
ncbi:MAG TPA: hypothetical protein VN457_01805, partial [Chlamydiales bacterium]|nr:hypothetical protein [Chlamydiales bacterium]